MRGYLRQADEEDMERLFQWANEPAVRRNSFSTEEISYKEHQEWYRKLLAGTDCKQYIYMVNNEAVGQIRLTVKGEAAEISYSVSVEKRGMGYGKEMLGLLNEKVKQDFPRVKKLVAKVKPDNIVSQKVFCDTGYVKAYDVFEMRINIYQKAE